MNDLEKAEAWEAYEKVWAEMMAASERRRESAVVAGEAKLSLMRAEYAVALAWDRWTKVAELEKPE